MFLLAKTPYSLWIGPQIPLTGGTLAVFTEHSQTVPLGQREHSQMNTVGTPNEHTEISVLQVKLEAADQRLADRDRELEKRDETITDLRQRLDTSEQERRAAQEKVTALLTDQRETVPTPQTRPIFWWLLAAAILIIAAVLWVIAGPGLVAEVVG